MRSRSLDDLEIYTATTGALADALRKLRRYALNEYPVVLLGPTGTGKSTLARFVHEHSARARGPFESVNLGGLDEPLASSTLFGHMAGAFTSAIGRHTGAFEAANGGTLFCDEFAKAPLGVQRKLLDVLDRGVVRPLGGSRDIPVNVRLIFAANEVLADLVAAKQLLHDFLPRLGLMHVRLPRLCERAHEIPELLRFFIQRHGASTGYMDVLPHATVELESLLQRYDWPGNVRELENLSVRLLSDAEGSPELSSALLVDEIAHFDCRRTTGSITGQSADVIADAIARVKGNKARAARDLGMSRTTLYRKLEAKRAVTLADPNPVRPMEPE